MAEIIDDQAIREWLSSALRGERPSLPRESTGEHINNILLVSEAEGSSALLRSQLERYGHLHSLPDTFQKQLRAIEFQYVALNLSRQNEVKRILQIFQVQQFDFLLMKGEALANTIYPSPHLRTRCDTDLLFKDRNATETAWLYLEKEGYVKEQTLEGKFVGYQFSCSKLLSNGVTNTFDIHNQINDYIWFAKKFPFDELYANADSIDFCGQQVKATSSIYALMHANLHRISNKPLGTQDRLIWLYDIHLLCRSLSHTEWGAFCSLAEEKTMARVCLEGIRQCSHHLHTEIPNNVLSRLTDLAAQEPRGLNDIDQRWKLHVNDWLNNRGAANKLRQLKEHLFPSPEYMMRKYQATNRVLLPYYYVKRISQGVIKYLKDAPS